MTKIFALFFASVIFITSCKTHQTLKEKQSEVATGKIDDSFKYTCNEVGWQTYLPNDWNLLTKEETKKMNEKGKEAMEKSIGNTIDMSGLKELVNLKKDIYNSFLSTIEKYDINEMGTYAEHNAVVNKIISDTYTSKKIKFETREDSEIIDHVNFHTLEIKIYTPGSDKILLTQKLYSALLKGYDFAMTINYNNEEDKKTLMKIITGSKFL